MRVIRESIAKTTGRVLPRQKHMSGGPMRAWSASLHAKLTITEWRYSNSVPRAFTKVFLIQNQRARGHLLLKNEVPVARARSKEHVQQIMHWVDTMVSWVIRKNNKQYTDNINTLTLQSRPFVLQREGSTTASNRMPCAQTTCHESRPTTSAGQSLRFLCHRKDWGLSPRHLMCQPTNT